MKAILLVSFFVSIVLLSAAQTGNANNGKQKGRNKTTITRKTTTQVRGSGQYHGSRDTTPGSPMGTGGAGGDMSGSPAGSASNSAQSEKNAEVEPNAQQGTSTESKGSDAKKTNSKKKNGAARNRRM